MSLYTLVGLLWWLVCKTVQQLFRRIGPCRTVIVSVIAVGDEMSLWDSKVFDLKPVLWFNIKVSSYQFSNSHCADKTAINHLISIIATPILVKHLCIAWWRHQTETFSALLALCAGNSPVTGEFPAQRSVASNFDVFFDLKKTVEQKIVRLVIWDAIALIITSL